MCGKLAAVDGTPFRELVWGSRTLMSRTESMLAASIKREVCRQCAAILLKESGETSEMIVVAVACDQRIDPFYVNAVHFDVIEQRITGVTEIEQHSALFAAAA